MKYQPQKKFNILTSVFLGITLTLVNNHNYVLAQKSNIVDPLCYWQTTDGRKVDLGILCNSKSQQIRLPLLRNNKNLKIGKVKLIRRSIDDYYRYVIVGQITNTGSIPQRYIEVGYQTYIQSDGKIKLNAADKVFTSDKLLLPGATTIFTINIRRNFTLFRLKYLDSIEERYQEIDTCYGYSVETQELCRRINPDIILRFDENYK